MTDRRPILLGMNNPLSGDPKHALYPVPTGCTGHKIWMMLRERVDCSRSQYLEAFDRRNLMDLRVWNRAEAADSVVKFLDSIRGEHRVIVVFGEEPRRALGLPKLLIETVRMHGHAFRQLPHPSGRNLFYNDPTCRLLASLLLEELYVDAIREDEL